MPPGADTVRFLADESCDFDVVRAVAGLGDFRFGCFVTLTPDRARVVKLPG